MKIYFDDPEYDGQFLRTLDHAPLGAQCPKEYVLFAASEGAGEHCEAGAREVFFQKMFDWLDPIMAS